METRQLHQRLVTAWVERGDVSARDELLYALHPVARGLARRYAASGEPFDDLVQVATIGLMKAVDRFDPARGVPVRGYARAMADGELRHYLRGRRVWAGEPPDQLGAEDPRYELIEARDAIEGVWRALDPREREALRLRIVEDLTYREIATRLGMSATHAVRLARRALGRLRAAARIGEEVD